jgi:hypothetical protein
VVFVFVIFEFCCIMLKEIVISLQGIHKPWPSEPPSILAPGAGCRETFYHLVLLTGAQGSPHPARGRTVSSWPTVSPSSWMTGSAALWKPSYAIGCTSQIKVKFCIDDVLLLIWGYMIGHNRTCTRDNLDPNSSISFQLLGTCMLMRFLDRALPIKLISSQNMYLLVCL